MDRKLYIVLMLSSFLFICGCSASNKIAIKKQKDISPLSYGLLDARTDIERYQVLLSTHKEAIERGVDVNYSGIKSINIEVPDKSSSIPLTPHTDFRGCVINVRNNVGDAILFTLIKTPKEIQVSSDIVETGAFESINALNRGLLLLLLEDKKPWVEDREGYDYSAYRKDVLVIKDGKAQNSPIKSYCTKQTELKCSYIEIEDSLVSISNLVINRTQDSGKKTYGFLIKGSYNVHLNNITVNTPEGTGLWADGIFKIRDCAHVIGKDIRINGTYSLKEKYGYGFELDNIYDFQLYDSDGYGEWGVFGSNNMNTLKVKNCNLNRVDIHLYGRDVTITDCQLSDAYNQFSGVYGKIIMERCDFSNFIPLINGTSYNTYVPYDLYIRDCEWNVTENRNVFLRIGLLQNKINPREELSKKSWPNIYIDGLTVNIPKDLDSVILIELGTDVSYPHAVGNISNICIKNLSFNYDKDSKESTSLILCNKPVSFENNITCTFDNIQLLNKGESGITQINKRHYFPGAITYNIHSEKGEFFSISNSTLGLAGGSNYQYDLIYNKCVIANVGRSPSDSKEYLKCRRTYKDCKFYLNILEDGKYFLDNHASYQNCVMIPLKNCDVDFKGQQIDVHFTKCYIKGGKGEKYTRNSLIRELSNGSYDGNTWRVY